VEKFTAVSVESWKEGDMSDLQSRRRLALFILHTGNFTEQQRRYVLRGGEGWGDSLLSDEMTARGFFTSKHLGRVY